MLQRFYLLTFVSLIFVLALAACTQDLTSNNNDVSRPSAEPVGATTQTIPTPRAFSPEFVSTQETLSTAEIARKLAPSVVQIATETLAFGSFNQPVPSSGVGTGIILDQDGHILTNNHVVADAQDMMVNLLSLEDRTKHPGGGLAYWDV
jgi:S1-C subfamily serine protease